MDSLQRRRPVGNALYTSAAVTGPLAASSLAGRQAELAGVEIGLQDELEADGGKFEGVTGELSAQRGGRGVVVHGVRAWRLESASGESEPKQ